MDCRASALESATGHPGDRQMGVEPNQHAAAPEQIAQGKPNSRPRDDPGGRIRCAAPARKTPLGVILKNQVRTVRKEGLDGGCSETGGRVSMTVPIDDAQPPSHDAGHKHWRRNPGSRNPTPVAEASPGFSDAASATVSLIYSPLVGRQAANLPPGGWTACRRSHT